MKLRIGHSEYHVTKEEFIEDEGNSCLGLINYHDLTIKIKDNLNIELYKKTLIHEIVHGIMRESGFENDDIHTEDLVNRIGLTLHGFLKDNIEQVTKLYGE